MPVLIRAELAAKLTDDTFPLLMCLEDDDTIIFATGCVRNTSGNITSFKGYRLRGSTDTDYCETWCSDFVPCTKSLIIRNDF